MGVSGYVGLPTLNRGDRSEEYVFVNGRPASAPLLGAAIREAYRTLLPRDRFPSLFLFLRVDPRSVDVNVHPTKREVRFRQPSEVRDVAIGAIRRSLAVGDAQGPVAGRDHPAMEHDAAKRFQAAPQEVLIRIEDLPEAPSFRYPRMPIVEGQVLPGDRIPKDAGLSPPVASPDAIRPSVQTEQPPVSSDSGQPPIGGATSPWSWCRVLGQIGSLYVVLETEDGYVIMDPHAAHERVLFDRFMALLERSPVETQGLLTPETVNLMPRDAACVRQNIELLANMGFGVSEFGGDTFVVDAMPVCFAGASAAGFLAEAAQMIERGGRGGGTRWREEAIAQAACKAAVKRRDRLSLAEIEQLVVDLATTSMPYTCPHGRPTLIYTSFKDLNRKFGRSRLKDAGANAGSGASRNLLGSCVRRLLFRQEKDVDRRVGLRCRLCEWQERLVLHLSRGEYQDDFDPLLFLQGSVQRLRRWDGEGSHLVGGALVVALPDFFHLVQYSGGGVVRGDQIKLPGLRRPGGAVAEALVGRERPVKQLSRWRGIHSDAVLTLDGREKSAQLRERLQLDLGVGLERHEGVVPLATACLKSPARPSDRCRPTATFPSASTRQHGRAAIERDSSPRPPSGQVHHPALSVLVLGLYEHVHKLTLCELIVGIPDLLRIDGALIHLPRHIEDRRGFVEVSGNGVGVNEIGGIRRGGRAGSRELLGRSR